MMLFCGMWKEGINYNRLLLPDKGLLLGQQDPSFFLRPYRLLIDTSLLVESSRKPAKGETESLPNHYGV